MIDLIWMLAIYALIAWVIWWIITHVPIPEPFATPIRVVFMVVCALVVIGFLLSLAGHGPSFLRLRL